jgi:aromatic ring-cleaving dioxygenase
MSQSPQHPTSPSLDNDPGDQAWADLLSPTRRRILLNAGLATAAIGAAAPLARADSTAGRRFPDLELAPGLKTDGRGLLLPIQGPGKSPWGPDTASQPTTRPAGYRPDEQSLPATPRPYTQVKSYHAHIYFDDDSYEKAAQIRRWSAERFPVELGDWNLEPRGPHVTPSFYFGFNNELLPILIPWLQLNSLGLTILLHPNTGDPRSDHLYYALWVNRSQPVNAYAWRRYVDGGGGDVDQINPNVIPTVPLET